MPTLLIKGTSMRIALIAPYSSAPMRGNIVTVQRIAQFMNQADVATVILAVDNLSITAMQRELEEFKPDLIHGFHAHYSGAAARTLSEQLQIPYLLTITGSDLQESRLRNHPDTLSAIEAAEVIVCFHDSDAHRLTGFFPGLHSKVAVVPQGVEQLPTAEGADFDIDPEAFVLLLPAALRPVKNVEFPIESLSRLVPGDQKLQLVIAGGEIDQDYAALIHTMVNDSTFASWPGEVPHELMGSLYERADLVLNCSHSESMPNSLMEAMAIGRPVLASDIPGNRSLIQNGINGLLYDGEEDFLNQVMRIRENEILREKLGRNAKEYIRTKFSPQQETESYMSIYRKLIATGQ